jgi:uncharacterized protein (TIGR02594 family)
MTTKPAWLERLEAYEAEGFAEVPGKGSNPKIVAWMTGPGKGTWVKSDATPWCGGTIAGVLSECNLPHAIVKDPLAAVNWLNLATKLDEPRVGAIVVFKRTGGHHVTVVKKFDATTLWCLGGNQSDKICTVKYKRKDALGYRWPVPLVTPKELAGTSRIAAAAEQQKKDNAKGQAALTTTPVPVVTPNPPPTWRESLDGTIGDISWAKGVVSFGADFGGFVGANWTWIALGIAAFYFGRSWWNANKISAARVEDANLGWTT